MAPTLGNKGEHSQTHHAPTPDPLGPCCPMENVGLRQLRLTPV